MATSDGVSNITATADDNFAGSLDPNVAFTESYLVGSSGLVQIPFGCTVSASSTTCDALFLFITPSKAVGVDASPASTHPIIITLEQ